MVFARAGSIDARCLARAAREVDGPLTKAARHPDKTSAADASASKVPSSCVKDCASALDDREAIFLVSSEFRPMKLLSVPMDSFSRQRLGAMLARSLEADSRACNSKANSDAFSKHASKDFAVMVLSNSSQSSTR